MNFKKFMVGFSFALPLCVLIRVIQMVFFIEYSNGFYIVGKNFAGNLCLGIIALICAAVAFLAFKTEKISIILPKKDWLLAIVSFASAITLFNELFGENMPMTMSALQVFIVKIVTTFTAVYFILFCLHSIIGFKVPPLLHIMPIIYTLVKTFFSFMNFSSLALISDNILLLASYSSLMLFFINYAKLYCGIKEKGFKKFLATSCVSAVITLTASAPNIIINIFSKQPYTHTNTDILATLFAFGIFIILFVLKTAGKKEHI